MMIVFKNWQTNLLKFFKKWKDLLKTDLILNKKHNN